MKLRAAKPDERAEGSDATRARILAATRRCLGRWGLAKTGIGDIAKEAGCARQTVYNHFPTAEAVVYAALWESSEDFVARLRASLGSHEGAGDRIVEAMMFCLRELPKEPLLELIAEPQFAPFANLSLFRAEPTWTLLRSVAAECLAPQPALASHADELAEMMTRVLLSLLTLRGPHDRDDAQTRALLERWLLRPLDLATVRRGARPSRRTR